MNKPQGLKSRLMPALSVLALAMTVLSGVAHAVTLPPPPVSPAPVTDYEYDAKGNLTKVIKAKGVAGFGLTTQNAYDSLDRVKTSTDPKSGVVTLGYDGQDNVSQVTDPRSLITQYQRNGLGDMTQLSSPDTGTANSTYDAGGNLLTRTDSRGVLATYTYDNLSRATSVTYTQTGQTTVSYGWTYDQSGGNFGYGVGRLTTATFPSGNTQYGYDQHGRLITNIQTVGTVSLTTRYTYDGANNVTSITYPSGRIVTYTYVGGQLNAISMAKDAASASQPLISDIQWQPFGPPRSWQMHMASGTKLYERVFDQYGRLVRYPLNNVVRDLTYDVAGRIVNYTHLDATTGLSTAATQAMEQSFGYDELGRLITITTPAQTWNISYDANGNRTNVTLNGVSRDYTTSPTSNRLNQISNPTRSFGYDAAGNTTTDSTLYPTATYATDNRLNSITKAGITTSYSYDANGRRVEKLSSVVPENSRLFVYGFGPQILGEYDTSGLSLQEIVWVGENPLAVIDGSGSVVELFFAYNDHLGAVRILVDVAETERWRWSSEPYGSIAADSAPSGNGLVRFQLRFPGQYYDEESGLSYNNYRNYDSVVGRYAESDPVGLFGGGNTYTYANGDPVNGFDATGLQAVGVGPGGLPIIITPENRELNRQISQQLTDSLNRNFPKKTYQTYTRYNRKTRQCYSGRTSGYDDPFTNVKKRGSEQKLLNSEGFDDPVLDKSSDSYTAIRGREQLLIDVNGGAQSGGGTSRNRINGVSPGNILKPIYINSAVDEFGIPIRSENCTCH